MSEVETICQRQRDEATLAIQREHKAHWREDGTCSYCGSIREEAFFAAIAAGEQLSPTDKSYKAYIEIPDPEVGKMRIMGSANHPQTGDGWVHVTPESLVGLPDGAAEYMNQWVLPTPHSEKQTAKFYFQHLSDEGRTKLIDLANKRAINFAYPGHFYVAPFFAVPANKMECL